MCDFEGRIPGESIESFIDRVVNPDSKYNSQIKIAINKVAELMKSKSVDHKIATTVKVSQQRRRQYLTSLTTFTTMCLER